MRVRVSTWSKWRQSNKLTFDPEKGIDLHVPVSDVSNLAKLQGLVNIHFHFYNGSK